MADDQKNYQFYLERNLYQSGCKNGYKSGNASTKETAKIKTILQPPRKQSRTKEQLTHNVVIVKKES